VISLQWFHMACCWQPAMPLSNEDSSVFVTRKHCHHESVVNGSRPSDILVHGRRKLR
jgi:hypothetical protein